MAHHLVLGPGDFDVNVPCTCTQLMLRCMGGWGNGVFRVLFAVLSCAELIAMARRRFHLQSLQNQSVLGIFHVYELQLATKNTFGAWQRLDLSGAYAAVSLLWNYGCGPSVPEINSETLQAPLQKSFPAPLRLDAERRQQSDARSTSRQNVEIASLDGLGTWWSQACSMACIENSRFTSTSRDDVHFWQSWMLSSVAP